MFERLPAYRTYLSVSAASVCFVCCFPSLRELARDTPAEVGCFASRPGTLPMARVVGRHDGLMPLARGVEGAFRALVRTYLIGMLFFWACRRRLRVPPLPATWRDLVLI